MWAMTLNILFIKDTKQVNIHTLYYWLISCQMEVWLSVQQEDISVAQTVTRGPPPNHNLF